MVFEIKSGHALKFWCSFREAERVATVVVSHWPNYGGAIWYRLDDLRQTLMDLVDFVFHGRKFCPSCREPGYPGSIKEITISYHEDGPQFTAQFEKCKKCGAILFAGPPMSIGENEDVADNVIKYHPGPDFGQFDLTPVGKVPIRGEDDV